jgi:hypothetical protein
VTRGDGNTLWGWQSQQSDGTWSLIAMFLASEDELAADANKSVIDQIATMRARNSELMVLVHREPAIARAYRTQAMLHRDRYGQPVRFARFDLGVVVEEIEGRA